MAEDRRYIAIDLKSFYASVECVERGLDPLDTNLVVADSSRTDKTICLAVSPSLKKIGTGGRPRLFEVIRKVKEANRLRQNARNDRTCNGKSAFLKQLDSDPMLDIDYITAPPRMAHYVDYSTRIYNIYLRHVAPEDILVYSIDEVFIDATPYLKIKRTTAHDLAMTMIRDVLRETGITATAGIGTNLYLAKIAMDIVAKRMPPDSDGVRIAELDTAGYRRNLWAHTPLTDFWRIGAGTARRLSEYGIKTMGDIARCSLKHEHLLYRLFGVNAELIIDHAWGWEPVTIDDAKSYKPESHSISSGQVLTEPYTAQRARIVIMEMAESVALDLLEQNLTTDSLTINIGYDCESISRPEIRMLYNGPVDTDHYGRLIPRHAHGTFRFKTPTCSINEIIEATSELFDNVANRNLLFRRLNVTANNLISLSEIEAQKRKPRQLTLFAEQEQGKEHIENERLIRERRLHHVVIDIKQRFGKNAILKGLNFADGATQRQRNGQIGGHKA